jgi:hypothetical protein
VRLLAGLQPLNVVHVEADDALLGGEGQCNAGTASLVQAGSRRPEGCLRHCEQGLDAVQD